MKFYSDHVTEIADTILARFESGELPKALAQVFLNASAMVGKPSEAWSFSNQLLMVLRTSDARGFKQWGEVGRKVKKGAKAFYILAPVKRSFEQENEEGEKETRTILRGFRTLPVFGIEQTEVVDAEKWEASQGESEELKSFVDALPFVEVAKSWGLDVGVCNAGRFLGVYRRGSEIKVGVKNLATWAHELCHAADDKAGNLKLCIGQDPENEIVAELGGAILLSLIGEHKAADLGGAWEYIKHYSDGEKEKALHLACKLIKRTCEAVQLIIDTAESLHEPHAKTA
jgi:hypothetical protein